MPSRNLSDLCESIRPKAVKFLSECELLGIDVIITCTYRNNREQEILYSYGRTRPGKIVTWAPPGHSKHNYTYLGRPAAQAFDVVPIRNGKPVWGTTGEDLTLWKIIGAIGEDCGLKWAGRWQKSKREFPHFEV